MPRKRKIPVEELLVQEREAIRQQEALIQEINAMREQIGFIERAIENLENEVAPHSNQLVETITLCPVCFHECWMKPSPDCIFHCSINCKNIHEV